MKFHAKHKRVASTDMYVEHLREGAHTIEFTLRKSGESRGVQADSCQSGEVLDTVVLKSDAKVNIYFQLQLVEN